MTFCSFNHQLEPKDVSESWFQQRAFQFGDGHFTTAKIEDGDIVWWSRHLNRLQKANKMLGIDDIEWQQLSYVCQTMSKPIEQGYIKIQISRGQGIRGYQIGSEMKPLIFITANEMSLSPLMELNQPLAAGILNTRLGINPQLAGFKHTNRIEQSLIQVELNQRNLSEGLVADVDGYLIESSKGNVFWLNEGKWHTPKLESAGIDGVFRQFLLERYPEIIQIKAQIADVYRESEAMFVTNAIAGATPISELQWADGTIDDIAKESSSRSLSVDLAKDFFSDLALLTE